jgi:hypothetical protein
MLPAQVRQNEACKAPAKIADLKTDGTQEHGEYDRPDMIAACHCNDGNTQGCRHDCRHKDKYLKAKPNDHTDQCAENYEHCHRLGAPSTERSVVQLY